jgi:hypothetical protein
MKRIRLRKSQLHRVIRESVSKILKEDNQWNNFIGKLVCVSYDNSARDETLGYFNGIKDDELILKNAIDGGNNDKVYSTWVVGMEEGPNVELATGTDKEIYRNACYNHSSLW